MIDSFNEYLARHYERMERWNAIDRHYTFLRHLDQKAEIAKQSAIHEIRKMFAEAFPNRFYAFLVQRPQDKEPWPTIFSDAARAHAYPHRHGPVVEVLL